MAFRTWGKVLLTALGVGLVAGAGQLGIAYGLGIVRFNRAFEATTANQWPAQLVWVGWFALVAAVAGTVVAHLLTRRYDLPVATGTRLVTAIGATVGALVVAPLSMRPARTAEVAGVDPVTAVGTTALLGAVVGLATAVATLHWRTVAHNVAAFVGFGWLLALISVLPSLGPTDPLPAVRLGALDPSWLGTGSAQRLAVVLMPALALVVGALIGALARRDGRPVPVVATAGLVGPATFAMAYLLAGAGGSADGYQAAPYWGALVAVAAGAVGSGLAAVLRWPLTGPETTDGPGPTTSRDTPDEPTTRIIPADEPTVTIVPPSRPTDEPTTRIPPTDEPTVTIVPPPEPTDEPTSRTTTPDRSTGAPKPEAWFGAPATPGVGGPDRPGDEPTAEITGADRSAYRPGNRPLRVEDFWPTSGATSAPTPAPEPAPKPAPVTPPSSAGVLPVVPGTSPTPPAAPPRPAAHPTPPAAPPPPVVPPARPSAPAQRPSVPAPAPVTPTPAPVTPAPAPVTPGPRSSAPATSTEDELTAPVPTAGPAGTGPGDRTGPVDDPERTAVVPPTDREQGPDGVSTDGPDQTGSPGRRRGLFRRNRSGQPSAPDPAGEPDAGPGVPGQRDPRRRGRTEEPVSARDEEYVDWVSGLSQPDPATELDPGDGGRRSLRRPGRHHAD
ncbi:TDT family transporter [Plantactinospora sonchi]|uniref:Uncharacterized protein n=1 Tax=Plantactinospora sonchi TaxID=1544735 RepID=A0ABU7RV70_9ACTN